MRRPHPWATLAVLLFVCGIASPAPAQDRWVSIGPDGAPVSALAIHPTNPSIVYAGMHSQGVYRSADGASSWTEVNSGLTNLSIHRLAIDPDVPSTIYAATGGGVYRTANSGGSWSAANTGLPTSPNVERYSLVIDPVTPSTLYFSDGVGVYRTIDSGDHWARVDTDLPAGRDGTIYSLAIHPSAATLYAGGRGRVFRSTDRGEHWVQVSVDLHQNAGHQELVIDPVVTTTLYYSGNEISSGGVWRSRDGGVTWTHVLERFS